MANFIQLLLLIPNAFAGTSSSGGAFSSAFSSAFDIGA